MSKFDNRLGFRTSAAVLLLICLFSANGAAMIYRPSVGRFKDGFMLWHNDQYYLFSMYTATGKDDNFRNVWLATSGDGVHWKDVGAVVKDAPFNIWAMAVHRVGDKFIMNHGSFGSSGAQNVIRFWESADLVHWKFMGHEADLYPDRRWYSPDSRLDCMSVVPVVENGQTKYYGFATGPGGFLESKDGLHWSGKPHPKIDWGAFPPPPTTADEGELEIGGCHEINGKYYLVGGWFNYMGGTGYGVYTLVADAPSGPFLADAAAYRLCGNSTRWVAMWARFCQTNKDLLINGYMYSGYSYETGETWLPPVKRAVVDSGGHLRLGYWKGNEILKGMPSTPDLRTCKKIYPAEANQDCRVNAANDRLELLAHPERNSLTRVDIPTTLAVLDGTLDSGKGIVVEGTLRATCMDRRTSASSIGFYLEEKAGQGTAIKLHTYGQTEIGKMTLSDRIDFRVEDVIGPGCAAPAGITPHVNHTFRLMIRKNMFELYVDDMFVQTFNTTHETNAVGLAVQRLGFLVENGQGFFENVRVYPMTLDN